MAEAMNYRMNLVIDPKNVIKANRELRAMERYFERIQGRVMRIGRTRMAPEIVLKDSASKGLDNLLAKMQRVKSQVIQASANVKLNVQKQVDTNLNLSVQKQIQASVMVDLRASGLDFSPMIGALQANTDAVNQLTSALGEIKPGGGSGNKSGWETAIGIFAGVTTFGLTMKSGGQLKDKWKGAKESRGGGPAETKPAEVNKGRIVRPGQRGKKATQNTAAAPKADPVDKPLTKWGKRLNRADKTGDLVETVGNLGGGVLKGMKFVWDGAKDILGGGGGASGIISGGLAGASKTGAGSDAVKQAADGSAANAVKNAGKNGLGSGLMKGLGRRVLGPLGYIADATAIATAKPGKERNQAMGSAVGGGIGSTIGGIVGSVIPVAGTLIGATLGGTVGSFVGEKVGGAITGISEQFNEGKEKVSAWFSKTFSFGKKDEEAVKPKAPPPPPNSNAAALPAPIIPKPAPADFSKPLLPNPSLNPMYGSYVPPSHSTSMGTFGPPASAAQNQAFAGKPTSPQSVQISPDQMSTISGLLMDFKTETTVNYNLPPGAVQVTVHEEHPVDVEGLILLIGQRLRAEFSKAAQNRKPTPMAY